MRILGIDPGLATIGYGVIDARGPREMDCVSYGAIKTPAGTPIETRLNIIFEDMGELIERYKPQVASVEKLFFKKNVTTGIQVAQARGVVLLSLCRKDVPFFEYTPMQIKSRVLGYGLGEKSQIQYIIQRVLNLAEKPKPDDAADGLALAICHHYASARLTR